MICIFCNPTTQTLQVGLIYKKLYTSKGKRFNIIAENGSVYLQVPLKEDCAFHNIINPDTGHKQKVTYEGYVDLELTATLVPHISTNLNTDNQGNYRDKKFIPSIRKVSV